MTFSDLIWGAKIDKNHIRKQEFGKSDESNIKKGKLQVLYKQHVVATCNLRVSEKNQCTFGQYTHRWLVCCFLGVKRKSQIVCLASHHLHYPSICSHEMIGGLPYHLHFTALVQT